MQTYNQFFNKNKKPKKPTLVSLLHLEHCRFLSNAMLEMIENVSEVHEDLYIIVDKSILKETRKSLPKQGRFIIDQFDSSKNMIRHIAPSPKVKIEEKLIQRSINEGDYCSYRRYIVNESIEQFNSFRKNKPRRQVTITDQKITPEIFCRGDVVNIVGTKQRGRIITYNRSYSLVEHIKTKIKKKYWNSNLKKYE